MRRCTERRSGDLWRRVLTDQLKMAVATKCAASKLNTDIRTNCQAEAESTIIFRHRVPAGVPSRSWRLAGRHFRFAARALRNHKRSLGFSLRRRGPSVRGGWVKGMCGKEFRYRQRAYGFPRCRYMARSEARDWPETDLAR